MTRSLLVGLSETGLEEVLSAFQSRSYQAGDAIVEVGESGDELFLLAAGKVRVWSGDGPSVAERTLSVLGPGEHFGEASVIAGGARTATVTAVTYVETLVLSGEDYRRLVKNYPQLLENLSRSLTRRLSNMNVSTESQTTKRGVHSLAIVVDHESGWGLAHNLISLLRRNQQLVQPLLACDGPLPIPAKEFDQDAIPIRVEELGYAIAERSARALAVTVACGEHAIEAATKESNRVIFVVDAAKGATVDAQARLESIPVHRRPIVALMYDRNVRPRPEMHLAEHAAVRCGYTGQGRETKIEAPCVMRVYRTLMGKRIGLALGGGGARGIAHIGVLDVLRQHDVVFDSIAGTSAGAIVAASYGAGYTPEEVGSFFRKEMIPPRMLRARPWTRRVFLLHSFRGGRFETKLRRYLEQMTFAQADLPLAITTLDLISGEQKIRRQGDLVRSVLQSINHPVFGSPIIHDGEMLVDGGVLMNVPASVLRDEGCDHVISIDVGSSLSTDFSKDRVGKIRSPSYISTLLRTMDISRRHSSALHREESDLIILPQTSDFRIEDFHAVDPLIDAGRVAGEQAVENVKRVIANLSPTAA
ncbi:MAG: cyclic nucleotide-binding and patatin-like phospholipase domain-containing protein [Planctomycetota bacterium]